MLGLFESRCFGSYDWSKHRCEERLDEVSRDKRIETGLECSREISDGECQLQDTDGKDWDTRCEHGQENADWRTGDAFVAGEACDECSREETD